MVPAGAAGSGFLDCRNLSGSAMKRSRQRAEQKK
jgi:hypothetical protein